MSGPTQPSPLGVARSAVRARRAVDSPRPSSSGPLAGGALAAEVPAGTPSPAEGSTAPVDRIHPRPPANHPAAAQQPTNTSTHLRACGHTAAEHPGAARRPDARHPGIDCR